PDVLAIDAGAYAVGELARRELGSVHLLDEQLVGFAQCLEIEPQRFRAPEQQSELLVEDEQRRPVTAIDRRGDVVEDQQRLAPARRAEHERARSGRDPAAEQEIELGDAAGQRRTGKTRSMAGGHQAWKHRDPTLLDVEVVITAQKALTAALDDAQSSPLAPV